MKHENFPREQVDETKFEDRLGEDTIKEQIIPISHPEPIDNQAALNEASRIFSEPNSIHQPTLLAQLSPPRLRSPEADKQVFDEDEVKSIDKQNIM